MLKDGKCDITYHTITDLANNQIIRGWFPGLGILNGRLWEYIPYFFWLSKPGNRPADRCYCPYIWKWSATIWHAMFVASIVYLSMADRQQLVHAGLLLRCMHSSSHIYKSISHLVSDSLDASLSIHFILSLFPSLILLHLDPGPTSTLTCSSSFDFPPTTYQPQINTNANAMSFIRHATIEFMISLSEASSFIVRNNMAQVTIMVTTYISGMSKFDDDQDINI